MESQYLLKYEESTHKDFKKIKRFIKDRFFYEKVIDKINNDINYLRYMPRIHRNLIYTKDINGEYRRIVSGKYIIIYKIVKNQIIILRIFSQKQNYLNQRNFILKEKSTKYVIIK